MVATAFAAAEQVQTLPPRPPAIGQPRDPGLTSPQPTGTAVISGTVISVDGGRPMRRASVRLRGTSTPLSRATMTDDRGNFEFTGLPAGEFTLRAGKPGYLESIFGQKRPGSGRPGTPLSIADGQRLEKLSLSIPKGGVLTGTIVDDIGEPAFGVEVRAMRYAFRNGERALVNAGMDTTDDRGIYRIPTLIPGDYIVLATPTEANGPMSEDLRALKESVVTQGARGSAMTFAANVAAPRAAGASSDAPPSSGYAPVFYPSTTLAVSASPVTLGPAEEKSGIDIQLQLVPLGTITGTVSGDARAIQGTTIELGDSNTGLPGLSARTAHPGPDGRFTFTGIAPGQYTLTAKSGDQVFVSMDTSGGQVRMMMTMTKIDTSGPGGKAEPGGPPAPPMWAKTDVTVEGRARNEVSLVLQPGMSVTGRVAFDGTGQTPTDFSQMRVVLTSTSQGVLGGSGMGRVDADGRFKVSFLMPGRYRMSVAPPRGWRARSIDVDGRDALDFMLDVKANEDTNNAVVTFTNRPTELTGVLEDSSGRPTSDYTIILFAADQRYWTPQSRRILSTRPATDGKFSFRDLPAGDYKLVALDDAEPDSWFDPNVLRQLLIGSMSVTVGEGETKVQDIKVNR